MISKQQIKFIHLLSLKKYRRQHGMFVAEGAKIVQELLQSNYSFYKIYATKEWMANQVDENIPSDKIQEVSERELAQISSLTTPNEALALVNIPDRKLQSSGANIILALQSIRDPGNLGTIIRTCDWYGVKTIVCSEDCVDAYSHKVVQATMGSIFRLDIQYKYLLEYITDSSLPKYAASLQNSKSLHTFNRFKKGILLIGNESQGLSEEILNLCDHKLHIPRFGEAESLNAAVATGIFLDSIRREGK